MDVCTIKYYQLNVVLIAFRGDCHLFSNALDVALPKSGPGDI